MYDYDEMELESLASSVYVRVDLIAPARQTLEWAMAASNPLRARARARWLALLGQTYALDDNLDEACSLAGDALVLATCTRSDRAVLEVRTLRARLNPWKSDPRVRELDDQLAAILSWCPPNTA